VGSSPDRTHFYVYATDMAQLTVTVTHFGDGVFCSHPDRESFVVGWVRGNIM
jgi:hypothetical protein